MALWIVELRANPRSRWVPQSMFESLSEAKEYGWIPVSPSEMKIVKYIPAPKAKASK